MRWLQSTFRKQPLGRDSELLEADEASTAEDASVPARRPGASRAVRVATAVGVLLAITLGTVVVGSRGPIPSAEPACPIYSASGDRMAYLGLSEKPQGSCAIVAGWCGVLGDRLTYRDCDGDGILDPYCEGGELLKFGFLGSAGACKDNWPHGLCFQDAEPGGKNFKDVKVLPALSNEITIIHFNDIYQVAGVLEKGVRRGGMSRAAYVIQEERKRNPDRTFVVFAGDLLSPSVLSNLFQGEQMVDILNYLSIDAASLGNHEFDFGLDMFTKRMAQSKFPWLNINILEAATGKILPGTTERLIKEVPWAPRWSVEADDRKLKVCLFGSSYDVRESMFTDIKRISHNDTIKAARQEAAYLRQQGCHVVLALTHQFSQEDCEMSKALGKDIDLILGGHDHKTQVNMNCGSAPYVKADSDLKTQLVMSLFLDAAGRVMSVEAKLLELIDSDPFDIAIHDKVVEWEDKGMKEMGRKIGCSTVEIDARGTVVRQKESAMGNFFTDAVRAFHKTDVALINGGTMRGDKIYPKGELTKLSITSMHPFGNTIVKIYATGQEIRAYLEDSLKCYRYQCGNFPSVSGLTYTFDPDAGDGRRVQAVALPDGTPLADNRTLTVALSNFMLATYAPFGQSRLFEMVSVNDAVPIVLALFDSAVRAGASCIAPQVEGRIVVL